MALENPFVPISGFPPPDLIGREPILEHFRVALDQRNSPYRRMRISGIRGMGKTAVLAELERIACNAHWFVFNDEASPSLDEVLSRELSGALANRSRRRISEATVDVGPVHLKSELTDEHINRDDDLRHILPRFMGRIDDLGYEGLAILLDEVQDASIDSLRTVATTVQRVYRDHPRIVFVFAGLPSMVGSVIDAPSLTFLRRAIPFELTELAISEVMASMGATIDASGATIDAMALQTMAESTDGYPYLVQLIGHFAWDLASRRIDGDGPAISMDDVEKAVAIGRARFDETVVEPVLTRLGEAEIRYLLAMARQGAVATSQATAEAMGTSQSAVSGMRRHLIREQVIESPRRGYAAFAIPGMREYLLRHDDELIGS